MTGLRVQVMNAQLDEVFQAMAIGAVPGLWKGKSFPSLKPLASYVDDLLGRLDMFASWCAPAAAPALCNRCRLARWSCREHISGDSCVSRRGHAWLLVYQVLIDRDGSRAARHHQLLVIGVGPISRGPAATRMHPPPLLWQCWCWKEDRTHQL